MLRKDPNKRIRLEEIIECDWVKLHQSHKSLSTTFPSITSSNHSTKEKNYHNKSLEKARENNFSKKNYTKNSLDTSTSFQRDDTSKIKHLNSMMQTISYLENYSVN